MKENHCPLNSNLFHERDTRHKKDKHLGIRFLAMVARQFGFDGDAATFQGACEAAGLSTFKKGPLLALRVDERLQAFIREGAS